ncbi:MAG: leucine-rich repeat protein, partial [Prevotella sp.]
MRKVFTLLLMSIITSIGVWAQEEATASANFIVSDDGKTLTVSGKGDLTTLTTTISFGKIFTSAAIDNVFTNAEGTSVTEGSDYNSSSTYYVSSFSYTPTAVATPTAWNEPFGTVVSTNKWVEEKLSNLYTGYYSPWNTSIVLQSKVTAESTVELASIDATNYPENSKYFIYTGEEFTGDKIIAVSELEKNNVTWLTLEQLKEYFTTETKYAITIDNIFVSTDGGNTFESRPKSGNTNEAHYVYDPNEVFYQRSATYVAIENNAVYFEENPSYLTDKNVTNTFLDLLNAKIVDGAKVSDNKVTKTFETVIFKNEESSTSLVINDDIVQAILFPYVDFSGTKYRQTNKSIVTLDLGEATINDLSSSTFTGPETTLGNMTELTLPLTKLTSVYSESEKANVQKMVLPSQVLNNYSNYNPGEGQANLVTVTIPKGYDRLDDNAFYGNDKVTTFNLPSTLKLIGNSAFENCGALASITLNEGLENIGKRAFVGTALTEIDFPSSLRIINDAAFANLRIEDLKFNAGLYYIGNSAFALPSEMNVKTIEIPASVKYIGPHAFNFRQYQDVYFLGAEAPIMPMGASVYSKDWDGKATAFSAHTLMGNDGFNNGQGNVPSAEKMYDDA